MLGKYYTGKFTSKIKRVLYECKVQIIADSAFSNHDFFVNFTIPTKVIKILLSHASIKTTHIYIKTEMYFELITSDFIINDNT